MKVGYIMVIGIDAIIIRTGFFLHHERNMSFPTNPRDELEIK